MGLFQRFTRPRANLRLTTEKTEYTLGEELKGNIGVKSEEEFDIEEIMVSLICVESIKKTVGYHRTSVQASKPRKSTMSLPDMPGLEGDEDEESEEKESEYWEREEEWDQASLHRECLKICSGIHAGVGFTKEFPFVFKLPSTGRETYHSVDKNVRWVISTTMRIKGRRHMTKEFEFLVARPATSSKEIIREVVLIPCAYCGGLMPQTSTFCPNCGARRRG